MAEGAPLQSPITRIPSQEVSVRATHLFDKSSLCLSWMDERRTAGSGTEATDTSRGSAVSVRVCEQRYAAQRVLPESRFELQHAGSPSEEAAVEEAEE
jgi:hypothetical protein